MNSDVENLKLRWNRQGHRRESSSPRSRSCTKIWAKVERRTHPKAWESTFSWATDLPSFAKHRKPAVLPFAIFPILDQAGSTTRWKILENSSSPGIAIPFRAAGYLHPSNYLKELPNNLHPDCPAVGSFDSLPCKPLKPPLCAVQHYLQL